MIYDVLDQVFRYAPEKHGDDFRRAVDFLRGMPFDVKTGQHVLLDDLIYVNIDEYVPYPIEERRVEYHRDFVDLQTLLAGEEAIYYVPICELEEEKPYSLAKDCGFYRFKASAGTRLELVPGRFAIFFPGEGHMPCVRLNDSSEPVKKMVLKIHRSLFC